MEIFRWKAALTNTGAQIEGYIPDFAFMTLVPTNQLVAVARIDGVEWIGEYLPALKISTNLWAKLATNEVDVSLITFEPEQAAGLSNAIISAGGTVFSVTAGTDFGEVQAALTLSAASNLMSRTDLQWIEELVPFSIQNEVATKQFMNVTNIWNTYGLTGAGQIVGHADTGLDIGNTNGIHPDFAGRVLTAYALGRPGDWADHDAHGTHSAGSIVGDGSASGGQFRAPAYEAQLVHQSLEDADGGLGGIPNDLHDLFYQTYTNGARIHSDSWGAAVAGEYNSNSREADLFMWNYPEMLVCFSAGNSGVDIFPITFSYPFKGNGVIDQDSIGAPGTAKNVLTVGAAESLRTNSATYGAFNTGLTLFDDYPQDPIKTDYISRPDPDFGLNQGMAAFSSRGPTDDGRIKPDIVAPGTFIISCRSKHSDAGTGWGAYDDDDYLYMGGTSMSCPLTAGAATIVRQFYTDHKSVTNPSAALLKATLINGAESLYPGQYGTGEFQEIPDGERGNNIEGWGQVNLERSLYPSNALPSRRLVFYDQKDGLSTGSTNLHQVSVSGANEMRITLVWTDYPGTTGSGKTLVNDIDLIVEPPSGSTLYSRLQSGPDRINNVENIDVSSPDSGTWNVYVSGYNVPSGPQPYALVISGDFSEDSETTLTVQGDPAGVGGAVPAYGAHLIDLGTVTNVTAASKTAVNGTNYYFTGFLLDGVRQPDGGSSAENPLTNIVMNTDRTVTVQYVAWTVDEDNDGVGDWWAARHYGTNGVAADADTDGDGQDAKAEYYFLTDPNDGSDVFMIGQPRSLDGEVSFSFPTKEGRIYVVEQRPDLQTTPDWAAYTNVTGTGSPATVTVSSPTGNQFFRIRPELNEE